MEECPWPGQCSDQIFGVSFFCQVPDCAIASWQRLWPGLLPPEEWVAVWPFGPCPYFTFRETRNDMRFLAGQREILIEKSHEIFCLYIMAVQLFVLHIILVFRWFAIHSWLGYVWTIWLHVVQKVFKMEQVCMVLLWWFKIRKGQCDRKLCKESGLSCRSGEYI